MLLQTDGSRHHWFGAERPFATLVGTIDDATSRVTGAIFRDAEDAAGYFTVLAQTSADYGLPWTLYSDRHGIFVHQSDRPPTLTEQLTGKRTLTQVGRALEEAGIGWLGAGSAQAKGRVERLWGTLQDRLLVELRLETITTIGEANAFLPGFLLRHNARFAVLPADPEPAWRAWPAGLAAESVFCFHYPRRVARDATVSWGEGALALPRRHDGRGSGRLRDRARRTPRRLALGAPRGPPLPARRGPRSAYATPGPPSLAPQRGTARRASQRARPGA
jgi:hypothetical protein